MGLAEYREEPDREIIRGETVLMFPRSAVDHIRVAGNIYSIFSRYLKGKPCEAFPDGTELHLDEENILLPDAMIVCHREFIRRRGIFGIPDLVVEVLSPSTAKRDMGDKKDIYEAHGVREYWIANPMDRSVAVYHLQDGRFVLDSVCHAYSEEDWEELSEEERGSAGIPLKVSLYDDFEIRVSDIFDRVGTWA